MLIGQFVYYSSRNWAHGTNNWTSFIWTVFLTDRYLFIGRFNYWALGLTNKNGGIKQPVRSLDRWTLFLLDALPIHQITNPSFGAEATTDAHFDAHFGTTIIEFTRYSITKGTVLRTGSSTWIVDFILGTSLFLSQTVAHQDKRHHTENNKNRLVHSSVGVAINKLMDNPSDMLLNSVDEFATQFPRCNPNFRIQFSSHCDLIPLEYTFPKRRLLFPSLTWFTKATIDFKA